MDFKKFYLEELEELEELASKTPGDRGANAKNVLLTARELILSALNCEKVSVAQDERIMEHIDRAWIILHKF